MRKQYKNMFGQEIERDILEERRSACEAASAGKISPMALWGRLKNTWEDMDEADKAAELEELNS